MFGENSATTVNIGFFMKICSEIVISKYVTRDDE